MAKLFRLRDLFIKYPALDKVRTLAIARFFRDGITLHDRTHRVYSVITKSAQDYVKTSHSAASGRVVGHKPCIFAFFHGHMHCLLSLEPRDKMTILISNSRDGEMIARAATEMGFNVVRGSKTHGGVRGAYDVLEHSKQGNSILFNVDGPRGPRHIVKDAIIRIAEMSEMPIVPVVANARTKWLMKSWDRYMCPFVNSKTVLIYGEPIFVPPSSSKEVREELRARLERSMLDMHESAKQFFPAAVS